VNVEYQREFLPAIITIEDAIKHDLLWRGRKNTFQCGVDIDADLKMQMELLKEKCACGGTRAFLFGNASYFGCTEKTS
jgi:hypothetical protein